MTTLSTHDTKRSEDVRARLAVLAEIPREWTDRVRRWSARHPLPERSLELLAWQNLVGAWPIPVDRMAGYLTKAAKEAKLATSHVEAVPEVDEAVAAWPAAVLADAELVAEIEEFVARISGPGWSNSLGQKLLQLAGPGCPTSTRAPISSSTRWSTRTTAGRSTGRRGATCSPDSTRAGCPTSTRRGRRSSWSPRARCGCAATGRRSSPATARCPPTGPPPRTPWRSSGRRRWSRWRRGCRSGSPPAAGGATRCSRCPTGRRLARRRHRHRRRRRPHPGSRSSWPRYPVALLVRPA